MSFPAEVAREDQNLAAARHAGECALRYWTAVTGQAAVPGEVAAVLIEQWNAWWLESDGPDLELDDDDDDDDE